MVSLYKLELIEKNLYLTYNEEGVMHNGFTRLLQHSTILNRNKSYQSIFYKFKDKVTDYNFLILDFSATFKKLGIEKNQYHLINKDYSCKKGHNVLEYLFTFVNNETNEELKIYEHEFELQTYEDRKLIFEEVNYLSAKNVDKFIEFTGVEKFDENGIIENESILFIENNLQLYNFRTFFDKDSPIHSSDWDLKPNQIIQLSI